MRPSLLKKAGLFLFISFLTASAFFLRVENFTRPSLRTIDELVYFHLGRQVLHNPMNYSSAAYGRYLESKGRKVPEYFFQPLFKHPPLYAFMQAGSMKIMGDHPLAAGMVSIFFGAMLIPITYLLAARLCNRQVAILSALFIYMDPVNIICSQKNWMETTLVFFMTLALYFFVRGAQSGRGWWFVISGVAGGLAGLTKYPGLLAPAAILIYGLICQRALLRDSKFWMGMIMAGVVMLPWIGWNYALYGVRFLSTQAHLHDLAAGTRMAGAVELICAGLVTISLAVFLASRARVKIPFIDFLKPPHSWSKALIWLPFIIFLLMLGVFIKPLLLSLRYDHLPIGSWYAALFANENFLFYPGKLIEFSFIYALGLMSLACANYSAQKEIQLLKIATVIILVFFTAWGNFQSRYILPVTPFLIILGGYFWDGLWKSYSQNPHRMAKTLGRILLLLLIFFILLRGHHLNLLFSFGHDMCYF